MKIKFWQFEYEFDRDDAKIVVPVVLLLIGISTGGVGTLWLLLAAIIYYLLYFFSDGAFAALKEYLTKRKMRCPHCKNRKIILQGYQDYKSDEHYPYYFCDGCETTSILTDAGLLKIS